MWMTDEVRTTNSIDRLWDKVDQLDRVLWTFIESQAAAHQRENERLAALEKDYVMARMADELGLRRAETHVSFLGNSLVSMSKILDTVVKRLTKLEEEKDNAPNIGS